MSNQKHQPQLPDAQPCPCCGCIPIVDSQQHQLHGVPRMKMLEPRWATLEGASLYSGLSRAYLYRIMENSSIRTVVVKARPKNTRGRRLVDLRSLDAWIESWDSRHPSTAR